MNQLKFTHDVLGRIAGGGRVRCIVAVDDEPPAVLWLVTKHRARAELEVTHVPLAGVERTGPGQSAKWRFLPIDGDPIVVAPQNCSCGAGLLAYGDPTPGYERTKVRAPEWLAVVS